ncbi:hypothetical protein B566_EDAN012758 [Ephemera danica]|nr:hypothetical protein B566_EDAN012758 [Ephemera danica]
MMRQDESPRKTNSPNLYIEPESSDIFQKISSLPEIFELESQLAHSDFRGKWISFVAEGTAQYVCSRTDHKQLGRIIMTFIFEQQALVNMCFSGLKAEKFALKKKSSTTKLFTSISKVFEVHGIKKFKDIKSAIQDVLYKSNDDRTRKLRLGQKQ